MSERTIWDRVGRPNRNRAADVHDRLIDALAGLCPALLHDEVFLDAVLLVVASDVRKALAEQRERCGQGATIGSEPK